MNKLLTAVLASTVLISSLAFAADTTTPSASSGYGVDARAIISRNSYGDCWRTANWTPADAVAGCEAAIAAMAPVAKPAAAPAKVSEKITLAADALFDTNKSDLKHAGKASLDELVAKLKRIELEVIVATGHTDSNGTAQYNQKLSVRRANAVKAYLESKGVPANRIYSEGKGETQPVADNKTSAGRAQNRRVDIEIVGTHTK